MKVTDFLEENCIIDDLQSKSQKDVLSELSSVFLKRHVVFHHDTLVATLLEREKLGTTGVGEGIAMPHGKHPDFNDLIVSFGRSRQGVEFNAMDGKPVHLFFFLLHLKIPPVNI